MGTLITEPNAPIDVRVGTLRVDDFVKVRELIDTRKGTTFSANGTRTYTRKWEVIVKRRELGASMVCLAPGLPNPYASYMSGDGIEFDQLAVLVNYTAERLLTDHFYHWIVTAEYSTDVPEGGIPALTLFGANVQGSQNNPWLERPVLEWDWEDTTIVPPRDLDGKPYTNSVNMPFTPAPSFPAARAILVITRNEQFYSRDTATGYAYAVNSDVFLNASPGSVLSYPPRAKTMNRGPLQYYRITYRLKFNVPKFRDADQTDTAGARADQEKQLQTWQPELLDQGTHQLLQFGWPFAGRPTPIIRYGQPVTRDVLLDGNGKELRQSGTTPIVPKFRRFRQYQARPFAPIINTGIFGGL